MLPQWWITFLKSTWLYSILHMNQHSNSCLLSIIGCLPVLRATFCCGLLMPSLHAVDKADCNKAKLVRGRNQNLIQHHIGANSMALWINNYSNYLFDSLFCLWCRNENRHTVKCSNKLGKCKANEWIYVCCWLVSLMCSHFCVHIGLCVNISVLHVYSTRLWDPAGSNRVGTLHWGGPVWRCPPRSLHQLGSYFQFYIAFNFFVLTLISLILTSNKETTTTTKI